MENFNLDFTADEPKARYPQGFDAEKSINRKKGDI